ncbi:MAG: 2-oxo-4-hydroxy-4-carboxy-5-ureidoimidazoline decarboxylase [Gammaproteobacteria bacterium]|nr:2-oxo-4-hydroxy-4-carboxy-5-ureidoimidazoline decarboxylase [Gammaproteobacteria bacterium]
MFFSRNPRDMDEQLFLAAFGSVYENSRWVAEKMWRKGRLTGDVGRFAQKLVDIVNNASQEQRLALIRAHPDLAGRAAVAGKITTESREEQASAGLDRCTPDELAQLQELNARYKAKFGFPFVMAVKGASRQQILEAFTKRIDNDIDAEFDRAIAEIHAIARLRLQEIAGSD